MSRKNPHAVALGRRGGAKATAAQKAGARRNSAKGGAATKAKWRKVRAARANRVTLIDGTVMQIHDEVKS